jgi:hypothetical protein
VNVVPFKAVQPSDPLNGAEVLDRAHQVLTRYCILPTAEAADAVILWCAATHALPALPAATRLVVTSATKRSGKTRLLDVVEGLVFKPLVAMNATVAALFRSLAGKHPPTLVFDEVDTIFGTQRMAEQNEDLRGLLNAGFQRGKPTLRCVGPQQVPTQFATFAMVAMAGIGGVPDTIRDRAVNVRMRRRKAGETVRPFRERRDRPQLDEIRSMLTAWLGDDGVRAKLEVAEPEMDLEDRAADVWEPLLMVADQAGGTWPARARAAAARMVAEADDEEEDTESVRLLHDIERIFTDLLQGDFVPTDVLLQHLYAVEDSPWREMAITPHRLGAELKKFGVKSGRDTSGSKRGYKRLAFKDAWARYPSNGREPPE